VCGDFAFYQFPSEEFWRHLFARTPPTFRFAFKAPERITCGVFPTHPRYGPMAGRDNEMFLDSHGVHRDVRAPAAAASRQNLAHYLRVRPHGARLAAGFLERLDPFLAALPPEFRYAVEVRNPEFLAADYFACLRAHGVAHVYNAWSRMPELGSQVAIPDSATAGHLVCRALLRRGRVYENAVAAFAPYTAIQDPNPEARDAMRILIGRAREEKRMLFLFVNNRLEGNAPLTILSLVE